MTKFSTYLKSIVTKYKIYFCLLFIVQILASIWKVAVDYSIKEIIDTIQSNTNITTLLMLFIFYKLMHHGMFFINRLLDLKYKPIILAETITNMYTKTLRHSLHWFDSHLSGEISNKITDFQDNLASTTTCCYYALHNITTIVISIIFLLNVNALSAIVIFIFATIYTPVIVILAKKQMALQEQYVTAKQEVVGIINDSVMNIFGIKIIGNLWTELKLKLTPALLHLQNLDKKVRKFDAYWVDNADTIMVVIMNSVQIYLLTYLYQSGQITAGGFAFIAITTLNIHGELDSFLTNLLFNINPGIASMKASFSFINRGYDIEDMPNAGLITNVRGKIKFENICFAYSGSKTDVLHNFNLHIQSGHRIGIVGVSGAGKTTIIKCLLRYFDVHSGQILIDDQNITNVTQESLRANISVIPQDITMFHRTILENLQLAKHDASFDEVVEACKKAKIHEDIMQMTNGYHSIVGERGVKVSGGQRQRIAIARAILKDAPILILDEATSALDTPTEQLIQESLNEVLETSNATTIVIAHRLSTLLHMDRILVLDQGKIVEDGTHQELLNKNGMYKALWNAQVGGFLPDKREMKIDNIFLI
ncbi:ABC transporter ATP-binding protein [Wolbachia pipientis]|uniref:ABC transporter ATP-binding protein n=1 Tax=Wolbachia pipientis TaxID=955 RepID=UPI0015F873A5|nr:ABC transporter ATP-binding protein [Wolbachia pipientis]MBA8770149.1 ABC transporter ATP-binding protein [Wolbachia pipientis]